MVEEEKKEYHYCCTSVVGFAMHDDMLQCILILQKEDKKETRVISTGCNVFKVPGPPPSRRGENGKPKGYPIEYYQPQVEGTQYIDFVFYKEKDRLKRLKERH